LKGRSGKGRKKEKEEEKGGETHLHPHIPLFSFTLLPPSVDYSVLKMLAHRAAALWCFGGGATR